MAQKFIDLDALVGPPKRVKLADQMWTLPPDLPVDLFLKINRMASENASETDMIPELYDGILDLFRYGDPKLQSLPIGLKQLTEIIGNVYSDTGDSNQDAEAPPPKRSPAGTRSTSPSHKTSRSRQ